MRGEGAVRAAAVALAAALAGAALGAPATGTAATGPAVGPPHAPHGYAVTAIPLLPGLGAQEAFGAAINASGVVAGTASTRDGIGGAPRPARAFRYGDGTLVDLGVNPAYAPTMGRAWATAEGINDAGDVAGATVTSVVGSAAYVWRDGVMRLLPLEPAGQHGARDITNAGLVVGANGAIFGRGFVHGGSAAPPDLRWPDAGDRAASAATAANDAGEVVGWAASGAQRRAFRLSGGVLQPLADPAVARRDSEANAVAEDGTVVGSFALDAVREHAFVHRTGAMHDLGTLGVDRTSVACGVNVAGVIVGWSGDSQSDRAACSGLPRTGYLEVGVRRAVVWRGGAAEELNGLIPAGTGWTLETAAAINERGQIVGTGVLDGQRRAYLLTPLPPPPPPVVPPPAAVADPPPAAAPPPAAPVSPPVAPAGRPPRVVDRRAPSVTIARPVCSRRLSGPRCRAYRTSVRAWRVLGGRVADAAPSAGLAAVEVNVVRRTGRRCSVATTRGFAARPCGRAALAWTPAVLLQGRATWRAALRGLAPGAYTVRVRARDAAGNVGSSATLRVTLR